MGAGDGQRDPFSRLQIESFAKRLPHRAMGRQHHRAVGDDAEEIRNSAELRIDGVESRLRRCGSFVAGRDS